MESRMESPQNPDVVGDIVNCERGSTFRKMI
jgi:hypothetical protein